MQIAKDGKGNMKSEKKSLTKNGSSVVKTTSLMKEPPGEIGITVTGKGSGPRKSLVESTAIRRTGSLTPFPNIDEATSPSTNLIDDTTKQLKELMNSVSKSAVTEENLLKSSHLVSAACTCAKNIQGLLKLKLDIYKTYQKTK